MLGAILGGVGLVKDVLGGVGGSKGNKGAAPQQTGFYAMPDFAQNAAKTLVTDANSVYQDLRNTPPVQATGQGYMQGARTSYQNALAQTPNATPMFAAGDQFYDRANQFFDGAQGNINAGTQRLTDDRFNEYLQRYMNPYQQQVVNSTTGEIQRNSDIRRNQLAAEANAAGAFGTDRQGVEYGMLNADTLRQIGDTTGNLLYAGFNNAANNALSQYGTESNNALQGASLGIQGAGTAGNLGAQRYDQGFSTLQAQRDMADLGFRGNIANLNNAHTQQAYRVANKTLPSQYLGDVLSPFFGTQTGTNPGKPNGLTNASNMLNVGMGAVDQGSQLFKKFFGGGA